MMVRQQQEEKKEEDEVIEVEVEDIEEEEEVAIEEEGISKVEAEVEKALKVLKEANSTEIKDHELQDHQRIRKIVISKSLVRSRTSEEVEEEATTIE